MRRLLREYWIFWLLLAACLTSGLVAALLFQYADVHVYEFIIAAFLQASGVFLALSLAFLFFEQRTHRRQKNVDMAIENTVLSLRGYAVQAVLTMVNEIYGEPEISGLGPSNTESTYKEARHLALKTHTIASGGDPDDPLDTERYFSHVYWKFQKLDSLADLMSSSRQLLGPALMEYEDLNQSMQRLEAQIKNQGQIWKGFEQREPSRAKRFDSWERTEREFPGRTKRPPFAEALPREASYNLQSLTRQIAFLVDLLDAPGYQGDQDYKDRLQFAPGTFMLSDEWGAWRT